MSNFIFMYLWYLNRYRRIVVIVLCCVEYLQDAERQDSHHE